MIIDCISDLHGFYPDFLDENNEPIEGDLLIIAGDLTRRDMEGEYWQFNNWLSSLNHRKKIIVPGNHDHYLYEDINKVDNPFKEAGGELLADSGIEFEGLKIWGSPWTKSFEGMNPKCMAYTVQNDRDLMNYFGIIPYDIDILVTHSPAFGVLDEVSYICEDKEVIENAGSNYLYGWLKYSGRPKLHVFGHIHEAYGQTEYFSGCTSVNASHVNEQYKPVNKPIRIVLTHSGNASLAN